MNIDYMDIKAGMVIDGEETLMKHYNIFIQLQVVKQWGSNSATITKQQKNFNIVFNKRCWSIIANYYELSDTLNLMDINIALQFNNTTGYTFFYNVQSTTGTPSYFWIAIGK